MAFKETERIDTSGKSKDHLLNYLSLTGNIFIKVNHCIRYIFQIIILILIT